VASTCDKEDQAAENRRNFPFAAGVLAEFRAAFGSDVKLINAEENGKKIGNFRPVGTFSMKFEQWLRISKLIEFEQKNRRQGKEKK
jgi:hypothetical protein